MTSSSNSTTASQPDIVWVTDEMFTHHPYISYTIKIVAMDRVLLPPNTSQPVRTNIKIAYCQHFAVSVLPRSCWRQYITTTGPQKAAEMNETLWLVLENIVTHPLVINPGTQLGSLLLQPFPPCSPV